MKVQVFFEHHMKNFSILLLIAMLTACSSGEPSNSEINEAVKRMWTRLTLIQGESSVPRLLSVKKKACTAVAEKVSYKCEISLEMEMGGEKKTETESFTFMKQEDKWEIVSLLVLIKSSVLFAQNHLLII
ncbi:MAG: hypothetical protein Q4A28_02120 [Brachymonas sp.]|nr:hypothetical protein [Brachymonas sp.]